MVERKPGFIPGVTMQLLLHLAFTSQAFGGFRGGILIPPRLSQVEALEPGRLQQKLPDKPRIVDQVSAPQAARLGSQPEQPLQPITLHPYRRLTYPARVKVERRPNRDQDRRVEKWSHASHPEVLLGELMPTQTMSAFPELIACATAGVQSSSSDAKGGSMVPATSSFGKRV